MDPRTVLFLEDRVESIVQPLTCCEERGLSVTVVPTDFEFLEQLEDGADNIGLIVVDISLLGVMNLKAVGIPNSDTDGGNRAGWVIIDRLLRPETSDASFAKIPILVLSVIQAHDVDAAPLKAANARADKFGWPPIKNLVKGGTDLDKKRPWHEEFEEIIDELFPR